jgi:hypothetical protein
VQLITMFFLWMERLVLKVIALVKCLQAVLYRSNAKQCFGSGRPLGFVGCIQNVPHQHNLVLSDLSCAPGLNSSNATTSRHGEAAVGMDSLTAAENIALVLCDLSTSFGNNLPGAMNSHSNMLPSLSCIRSTIAISSNLQGCMQSHLHQCGISAVMCISIMLSKF